MGCGANTNISTNEYNKYHSIIPPDRELYIDKSFSPDNQNIFGTENLEKISKNQEIKDQENFKDLIYDFNHNNIIWKRTSEIFNNQEFTLFSSEINENSIIQGSIGNCYFLTIISCLTKYPSFIYQLFNSLYVSANGFYEIKLKINNKITIVTIDDYFPYNTKTNMPLFSKPYKNEIWVMLLEKAWAKTNGSYLNIDNGSPIDVLDSFLLSSSIEKDILYDSIHINNDNKNNIWEKILGKIENNKKIMMICLSKDKINNKKKLTNFYYSIVEKHYYNIIDIFENNENGKNEKYLRLRNPWGFNLKNENYDKKKNEFDFIIDDTDDKEVKDNENEYLLSEGEFIIDYKYFCYLFQEIQIYQINNFSFNILINHTNEKTFNIIYLNIKEFKNEESVISILINSEEDNDIDIFLLSLTIDIKNNLIINQTRECINKTNNTIDLSIILNPKLSEEYYFCLLLTSNSSKKKNNNYKFNIIFQNDTYFDIIDNVQNLKNEEIYNKIKEEFDKYSLDLNYLKYDNSNKNNFFSDIDDINLNQKYLMEKYPKEMKLLLGLKPMKDNKEKIIFRDKYIYQNNNYYLGEQLYSGNIRHGRGIYFMHKTGNMYLGYNQYDKFVGKGKIIYKNGNVKEGEFINGKLSFN